MGINFYIKINFLIYSITTGTIIPKTRVKDINTRALVNYSIKWHDCGFIHEENMDSFVKRSTRRDTQGSQSSDLNLAHQIRSFILRTGMQSRPSVLGSVPTV